MHRIPAEIERHSDWEARLDFAAPAAQDWDLQLAELGCLCGWRPANTRLSQSMGSAMLTSISGSPCRQIRRPLRDQEKMGVRFKVNITTVICIKIVSEIVTSFLHLAVLASKSTLDLGLAHGKSGSTGSRVARWIHNESAQI